jgi:hypothetical protein
MIGWTFEFTPSQMETWSDAFPNVNIAAELGFMSEWLVRHPKRRGTKRFVANWLKSEERKISDRQRESRIGIGPSDSGVKIHVKGKP